MVTGNKDIEVVLKTSVRYYPSNDKLIGILTLWHKTTPLLYQELTAAFSMLVSAKNVQVISSKGYPLIAMRIKATGCFEPMVAWSCHVCLAQVGEFGESCC